MSLLTPADLGGWRLPNRLVVAPVLTPGRTSPLSRATGGCSTGR
ncbi:hypothetical protein ACIA5G_36985 [Amycolatopsis sp. NPDC051758]